MNLLYFILAIKTIYIRPVLLANKMISEVLNSAVSRPESGFRRFSTDGKLKNLGVKLLMDDLYVKGKDKAQPFERQPEMNS
jgi:hypothetical protein